MAACPCHTYEGESSGTLYQSLGEGRTLCSVVLFHAVSCGFQFLSVLKLFGCFDTPYPASNTSGD
jgi:hypothetical protein